MAEIRVRWMTRLMWTCHRCGAQFEMDNGPEGDGHNTGVAVAHGKECDSEVRAGSHPGWLTYTIVPPVGPD